MRAAGEASHVLPLSAASSFWPGGNVGSAAAPSPGRHPGRRRGQPAAWSPHSRAERFVVLREADRQPSPGLFVQPGEGLQRLRVIAEQVAQDIFDPRGGWPGRALALLVVEPFLVGRAQVGGLARVAAEPCGKARSSTGIDKNGPEISRRDSHSAWCCAVDRGIGMLP